MDQAIDYAFFLGSLVAVLAVGFLAGRRRAVSVSGYFRGGNRLPWYAIGFSIIAAGISSEQFVGEMGYAYKLGMPVANWEWLVFPALSILLWIFVPLYVRQGVTTMPEYLEARFGSAARTLYACLSVGSYVFVNFALVFYTGGFALEKISGVDKILAVWILAALTGLYTVYGGLSAVAWTGTVQCVLLLAGGFYLFFAGMAALGWDVSRLIGEGARAHLFTPADHPEIPWTAFLILALSTNVWYYATNQYINQRCLAARDERHAKLGVLFAGGLQVILPLATCFPGMVYYALRPGIPDPNAAYPEVVAALAPAGLRGLVLAAIVGAIMSTISGLVNSTSTIVTLDILRRGPAKDWPEEKLVRAGRWSGAIALLAGALFAPVVMRWESLFRYAQDLWAPMAAPVVVVFLAGALWTRASRRGAVACIGLAILTVPFTLAKSALADAGVRLLPGALDNSLVFAGAVGLVSWALMASLRDDRPLAPAIVLAGALSAAASAVAVSSHVAAALLLAATTGAATAIPMFRRRRPAPGMWDASMLRSGRGGAASSPFLWWLLLAAILGAIYAALW